MRRRKEINIKKKKREKFTKNYSGIPQGKSGINRKWLKRKRKNNLIHSIMSRSEEIW